MAFWKFTNKAATKTEAEQNELRIEGNIIADDDIWFYEWLEIGHTAKNQFKIELDKLKGKDITVWIDSYGGDVFAAAGIYNALKEHSGIVTVKIDGKAMSAASVIAMAGDTVQMSPVSVIMIHNPLTIADGDMHEMRHTADILDTVKESIINAYQIKSGKTRSKISEMMDNETWMSSKAAIKDGFADSVLFTENAEGVENSYDFNFNRMAIVNSSKATFNRLHELQKQREDVANTTEAEIETAKAKLQLRFKF